MADQTPEQKIMSRLIECANAMNDNYFMSALEKSPTGGSISGLYEIKAASMAYLLEIGINLALRKPEQAREIIHNIEWGRTECQHPKDEYCIPEKLLEDIIGIVLRDEWPIEDGQS